MIRIRQARGPQSRKFDRRPTSRWSTLAWQVRERQQLPLRDSTKWLARPRPSHRPGRKLSDWHVIGPFAAADFKQAYNVRLSLPRRVSTWLRPTAN